MAQNTNTYNRIINQLNDLPSDCRWSHDGGDFWLDIKAAANAVMLVKVHIDEVVETEGPWWVEVRRLHGLGHLRQLMGSEATEEDADRMWHLLLNADKLVFDGHGNEWLIEDDDDRNWEAMVSEVIASQPLAHDMTRREIIEQLDRMHRDVEIVGEDGKLYRCDLDMVADRVESGTMGMDDSFGPGPWWVAEDDDDESWMGVAIVWPLYDLATGEEIGAATDAQCSASMDADNVNGAFLIDCDGNIVEVGSWEAQQPGVRSVFVA